jgi:hypothetical protein
VADEDALSPRRWTDGPLPEAVKGVPGVFGNMLSFLGGPHGCIGFRFSLYEYAVIWLLRATILTDTQDKDHLACARLEVRLCARGARGGSGPDGWHRDAAVAAQSEGAGATATCDYEES